MGKKLKRVLNRFRLTLMFAAFVFIVMFLTLFLVFVVIGLLSRVMNYEAFRLFRAFRAPLFLFCIFSLIMGAIIAALTSHLPLRPVRELMNATDKIAAGDYSVRLEVRGLPEFRDLKTKFNHMAAELNSVELLRTDFVNDFSHEFKTPIVSIRGFAQMLKYGDLTPEERDEYLDIILQESERLSDLATNVLNLSKVEQQTTLTNRETYNVSEQIRLTLSLLDAKWADKQIEFDFAAGEYDVCGNRELLSQVWLNLLDNAMKFSPVGGQISIELFREGKDLVCRVANQGPPIPESVSPHVFDKFYQGDQSHATPGNGLGLSLVRRILVLHQGSISLKSSDERQTVFEVRLPAQGPGTGA